MKRLDHPRIVRVHDLTECPFGFYMDYVNGANLKQFGISHSEPLEIVLIAIEIAQTIAHAHDHDVCHRDIKPENIICFFDDKHNIWIAYLTAFDLAWFPTATQLTTQAFGTLSYASPEQIQRPNSEEVHQKTTDVYSFGQLMFYMITGEDPIPLDTGGHNVSVLRRRTEWWPSATAANLACALFREATEVSPPYRVANFVEVIHKLDAIVHELRLVGKWKDGEIERFLREVAFGIVGHAIEGAEGQFVHFSSLSGSTHLELTSKEVSGDSGYVVEIRATPRAVLLVHGSKKFRESRIILNSRIDHALMPFRRAVRRSGTQGTYETFVTIPGVTLSDEAVSRCRAILRAIIGAIERT